MTDGRDAPTRQLTGGQALAEMLRLHGVGPLFGMGGFQLLPFYGAIRELGLEHHLIADERSGAWAADAYSRVTRRVGVCDATLGPGATNLVTSLVESLNAAVPVIAIVGDTNRAHSWKNMTQESAQVEILRPAVKELIRIESVERIPELVRRAYVVATSGRPGPVVLDVPEDVCHGKADIPESDLYADPRYATVPARRSAPDPLEVDGAAELLARANRPVILAGGGVHSSGAYEELVALAEGLGIPVANTMTGKGAIACTHQLSVGLFGRYSGIANDVIAEADCLFAVGTHLGEIATKRFQLIPPHVPVVQLDVLPEELGRTTRIDIGLVGDAALGLRDVLAASAGRRASSREEYLGEIQTRHQGWRDETRARLTSSEVPISVARLTHELSSVMPADSVLVADGGFASHWTALLYQTKRAGRTYIADRGFASIGYGLPGAIGARLGSDEAVPVVALTGDGGLNMTVGELETAVRVGARLVLVVVNNAASGYVKALQHGAFGGGYQSADLTEIDYAQVAAAFGCEGIGVDDPEELGSVLLKAIEADGPTVVDVKVTRDPAKMLPGVDNRLSSAT